MTIGLRPLSDVLGAEVLGVDLRDELDLATVRTLEEAWLRYQVLLFRDQAIEIADQRRLVNAMGELQQPRSRPGERKNPDIFYVANVTIDGERGDLPDGEMQFHTDQCYYENPTRGAVLYAMEIPSQGGNTMFASTYRAWETLSPTLKARVAPLDVQFVYDYARNPTIKAPTAAADAPRYVHPAVIVHPWTGRPCLLVNRLMAESFIGMDRAESDALLEELCAHIEQPGNIYEHVWRKGDVLMWDNLSTAHARTDFDPKERRALRRMAWRGMRPTAWRETADARSATAVS